MSEARKLIRPIMVLVCVALPLAVWAQSTMDGGIGGTVTDPTGAVITNASIVVRNLDTNEKTSGTTDTAGGYRMIHLRPGLYELTITAKNFSTFKADRIVVEVGRVTSVEAKLGVGTTAEVVQVSGEAPVINTVQADFTHNINTAIVNDMPINLRRWSTFALTSPGASADGPYGLVAFHGISGLLNNNTVDGGDNNNAYFSEERGRTRATATVGMDAIREFQVNSSNFSAEYGRAAGGVVNAVTKSGTNSIHGSGRLFATDSAMWAYNPFSTQKVATATPGVFATVPLKPDDRRWQFGGSVGGPIKKDKLFFFFNWDQQKENAPGVATPSPDYFNPIVVSKPSYCTVPTGATPLTSGQTLWCRGALPVYTGGKWVTPVPATPGVTQAQVDAAMGFIASITGPMDRNKNQHIWFPKIDWMINNKHTVTVNWNHMRWSSLNGVQTVGVVARADWGDDFVDVDTVNGRVVSLVSNTMTNEFRTSIGRENQYEPLRSLRPGEPTTGPGGFSPEINAAGYTFGRPYYTDRKAYPLEYRTQFGDILSMSTGKHLFKFGVDVNHSNDTIDHLYQNGGVYSFNTIADWISDTVAWQTGNVAGLCNNGPSGATATARSQYCYSSFTQGIGATKYSFATTDYSFFVQDDFHVAPRVTLNFGLRWEYEALPAPIFPNFAVPQTNSMPSDKHDFGPRLGFAWDLFGNGKTVLRAGYGLYYGRIINAYLGNLLSGTGASGSQLSTGSLKPCQSGVTCSTGAPLYPYTAGNAGTPAISVWGNKTGAPQAHQMDVVLEREISRNTVVSASFLWTAGQRLPIVTDANLPAAKTVTYTIKGGPLDTQTVTFPWYTGARPNTNYSQIYMLNYDGYSRYTGLVLQLNRRLTNGLQISANYTHGRATDNSQQTSTGTTTIVALDPNNLAWEDGTSGFDVRHRFNAAVVWQPQVHWGRVANALINGFSIAPLVSISSGAPQGTYISGNAPSYVAPGILGAGGTNRWPLLPKYSWDGPTIGGANLRVARRFRITEGKRFEVMGEVFNLSNHLFPTSIASTMYQISSTNLNYCGVGTATGYCSSSISGMGTVTQGNNQDRIGLGTRQFQVGARFEF